MPSLQLIWCHSGIFGRDLNSKFIHSEEKIVQSIKVKLKYL